MSIYKDGKLIAGGRQTMPLLSFMWADHQLNDISWLRADTFSWQSGAVYTAVYQHLVDDIDGITAESETVGGITISFYRAPDGHKITTDESAVLNIYNATGVAWYYIIDTANQRFKLPRTKFGITGLRDTVGNYVEPGLPNLIGYLGANSSWGTEDGTLFTVSSEGNESHGWSGSSTTRRKFTMDASNYNHIYGNSTTVQPPATEMYLYFYVGQFTQTAIENTAGLNASLFNNKVDLDGSNATFAHIVETYSNGTDWYRIWSDGWCEQGGLTNSGSNSYQTQTLLVPYKDTNYNINMSGRTATGNTSAAGVWSQDTAAPINESSFTYYMITWPASWRACGYIS